MLIRNAHNSANGIDSHKPSIPNIAIIRYRPATINKKVLEKETMAEVKPSESAVKNADVNILKPEKINPPENSIIPCFIKFFVTFTETLLTQKIPYAIIYENLILQTVAAEIQAMMPLQRACVAESQVRNKLSNRPPRAQSNEIPQSILRRCRQPSFAGDMLVSC